jgi:hypothetical protein
MPQQAAGIRIEPPVSDPQRHVGLADRDRDRRAARGPARDQGRVQRVDRRAEPLVGAERQHRQLMQVRLADDPGAGRPRPRQARGVGGGGRRAPLDRARPDGRRDVRHVDEVLDREPRPGAGRVQPGDECAHRFLLVDRRTSSPVRYEQVRGQASGEFLIFSVPSRFPLLESGAAWMS